MGAAWETIAFAFKTLGSHHQQNIMYLTWGQLLFLLSPLCELLQDIITLKFLLT
jgi:hypothetical protein